MLFRSSYAYRSLLLAFALLLKFSGAASAAVNTESVQALTYIEVRVEARGHAGNVIRQQANILREHRPPQQIVLMQEISRPERFAVLQREVSTLLTADERGIPTLTEGLADDLTAPPDRRLCRYAAIAPRSQADVRANFYVVAHMDIAVQDRSRVETALRKLATAARQSDGNFGFEILQQIDRPNHFSLISAWLGESPFRAFAASVLARDFRQTVGPLLGSPYDERLFRQID